MAALLLATACLGAGAPARGASSLPSQGLEPRLLRLGEPLPLKVAVPYPPLDGAPGAAPVVRIAAGDVFAAGRDALALLYPAAEPGLSNLDVLTLSGGRPVLEGSRPGLQLLSHALTIADVTGNGRGEIWLGSAPGIDCLEWDGQAFRALAPWNRWQNKPVVMAAFKEPGWFAKILSVGAYYSEEAGIGLMAAWWRDSMWGKAFDIRAEAFYHPEDRFACGDVNGDGAVEVITAASKSRRELPPAALEVSQLRGDQDQTVKTFAGLFPDAVAVADLNGNGVAEIYYAVNLPLSCTSPETAQLRGVEWNGAAFAQFFATDFRGSSIADLTAGDLDGDGLPNLYVATLTRGPQHLALSIATLTTAKEAD